MLKLYLQMKPPAKINEVITIALAQATSHGTTAKSGPTDTSTVRDDTPLLRTELSGGK